MSADKLKSGLTNISLIIGIVGGLFVAVQAYSVLPYRVGETEREIKLMKDERKIDREILIRIEEQLKAMREEIRKRQ